MDDGRWITINGRHVFLKKGQSPMDAFIRQKGKDKKVPNKGGQNKANREEFTDSKGNTHEFEETKPEDFKKALDEAKASQPDNKKWRVDNTSHSLEDYASDKLFRTKNGSTVAITPDGDIISVCSKAGIKGEGRAMLEFAVQHGGKKLDSYDGNFEVYTHLGFEPVSWTPFNEEYAPDDWKKGRDANEPVVFFRYVGKEVNITKEDFYKKVKPDEDYDVAMNKRDKRLRG